MKRLLEDKRLRDGRFQTLAQLDAVIRQEGIRTTQGKTRGGKPHPQRKLVHLGGWFAFLDRLRGPEPKRKGREEKRNKKSAGEVLREAEAVKRRKAKIDAERESAGRYNLT
jgi:hypothetical protein